MIYHVSRADQLYDEYQDSLYGAHTDTDYEKWTAALRRHGDEVNEVYDHICMKADPDVLLRLYHGLLYCSDGLLQQQREIARKCFEDLADEVARLKFDEYGYVRSK